MDVKRTYIYNICIYITINLIKYNLIFYIVSINENNFKTYLIKIKSFRSEPSDEYNEITIQFLYIFLIAIDFVGVTNHIFR